MRLAGSTSPKGVALAVVMFSVGLPSAASGVAPSERCESMGAVEAHGTMQILAKRGAWEAAIACAKVASQAQEFYAEAMYLQGVCFGQLGRPQDAFEFLLEAWRTAPKEHERGIREEMWLRASEAAELEHEDVTVRCEMATYALAYPPPPSVGRELLATLVRIKEKTCSGSSVGPAPRPAPPSVPPPAPAAKEPPVAASSSRTGYRVAGGIMVALGVASAATAVGLWAVPFGQAVVDRDAAYERFRASAEVAEANKWKSAVREHESTASRTARAIWILTGTAAALTGGGIVVLAAAPSAREHAHSPSTDGDGGARLVLLPSPNGFVLNLSF